MGGSTSIMLQHDKLPGLLLTLGHDLVREILIQCVNILLHQQTHHVHDIKLLYIIFIIVGIERGLMTKLYCIF